MLFLSTVAHAGQEMSDVTPDSEMGNYDVIPNCSHEMLAGAAEALAMLNQLSVNAINKIV